MGRERNQTVFFLNVGLCSYVTEGLFDRLKKLTKHFAHMMEPLNFSLSQFLQLFFSNRQLGLDFSDHLYHDKELRKTAANAENRQTCDFSQFSQLAFKKSPTFRFLQFFVNTRKIVIFAAA